MTRRLILPGKSAVALIALACAGPAAACTLCHSDPAQAVRAGLAAVGPLRSAAATGLPVLAVAAVVFGLGKAGRD